MNNSKLTISNIATFGDELAIAWEDGVENYLNIEAVRIACPCASCQGEPDATGHVVKPKVTYTSSSFKLLSIDHVGGYAVQFRWGDGHATGIYSYEYLRAI